MIETLEEFYVMTHDADKKKVKPFSSFIEIICLMKIV